MPAVGGGRGSGGRIGLGNYQGEFDATTLVARAFMEGDSVVYDNGSKLDYYIAAEDIPIGAPVPGATGTKWSGVDATVTSGISETDLNNRLRNYTLTSALNALLTDKADTSVLDNYVLMTALNTALSDKADNSDLNEYLRNSTYNLDKATFESRITANRNNVMSNDNDIMNLMVDIQALQTALKNLPSGGGGGDVTSSALQTALDELKNLLEAKINQKQDADTAATDAELAAAVNTLRATLQANIDTLTTQVGNIPITSDVLWATSKPFPASVPSNTTIFDTDWTLADDPSMGVSVSGDYVHIPRQYRGEIHVDMEASDGSFLQRLIVPLSVGVYEGFDPPFFEQLQVRVDVNPSDSSLLRLYLYVRGNPGRTITSAGVGGRAKVFGVSALPRAQVVGITQAQLDAAIDGIDDFYIDVDPRYAFMRTSGNDPDDLDGNFVFVFSHVPEEYALANIVEVNFQGIQAYRGGWSPSTEYIRFGFEPTALNNLRNNTGRNQAIWQIEITFFNGTTNLGEERTFVVIDRG